jgi:hypothetical protein
VKINFMLSRAMVIRPRPCSKFTPPPLPHTPSKELRRFLCGSILYELLNSMNSMNPISLNYLRVRAAGSFFFFFGSWFLASLGKSLVIRIPEREVNYRQKKISIHRLLEILLSFSDPSSNPHLKIADVCCPKCSLGPSLVVSLPTKR